MELYNPISTYRLQFNREFRFKDAEQILPYLNKLGIKTIYASPVLQAVKGSNHGYDVTNPLKINSEIGTEEEFSQLIEKVRSFGIGWIQDIVPNHMAFSVENPWISDVLEKGMHSEYYEFFDIIEEHPDADLKDKLMLPFFGKPLDELIENKELSLTFSSSGFRLKYFDIEYPVSIPAYNVILKSTGISSFSEKIKFLEDGEGDIYRFSVFRKKMVLEFSESAEFNNFISECIIIVNDTPELLDKVIRSLYYLPSFWRDTESRINYRRFFTINGLICLNIQNQKVFDVCHELIKKWIDAKMIDGLRIDHIDGLYNPAEYLDRLRSISGNEMVIYVEKILENEETLPRHWPVQGSTGYEFLSLVNNLLTNRDNGPVFNSFYSDWIKMPVDFDKVFYKNSRFILYKRLAGELDNLTRRCLRLKTFSKYVEKWQDVRGAIGEFLVACPVYKVYNAPSKFSEHEASMVRSIGDRAIKNNPDNKHALKLLVDLFLLKLPESRNESDKIDYFFRRCMQFTGPLMAKGIEDTTFYSYNPFIGHNEVGDSPSFFGISASRFHDAMKERLKYLPLSMNVLSTHDTKRGEDARARLDVLSDMPVKWMEEARRWKEANRKYTRRADDKIIPTANDEYLIYQVLCAHLPMNGRADASFIKRLEEYFIKAIREAKVNSSWSNPNEDYEKELLKFLNEILSPKSSFPKQLVQFMEDLIPHGIVNSLTQVILKNTVPGIPDLFQGTETWNFSFVDPDNRRDVNYLQLSESLEELEKAHSSDASVLAEELFAHPLSGKIKLWMNWLLIQERKNYPELFLKGSYIPLKIFGKYHKRAFGFYRHYNQEHLIVILPLSTATLEGDLLWEDTQIRFPDEMPREYKNILTGRTVEVSKLLHLTEVFDVVPFAVLRNS